MYFMKVKPVMPVQVYCDNVGAIFLSNNQESRMSKHLEIKAHFIRNNVEKGIVKVSFVKSMDNIADGFTKCGSSDDYKRNFKCLRNVCHDIGIS